MFPLFVTDFIKKPGYTYRTRMLFSASQLYSLLSSPYCVEATPEMYDYFAGMGCQMDSSSPREKWDGTHGVMVYGRTCQKNKNQRKQPPEKWIVCSGYHEPFISASQWLAVQECFKKNTFNKTTKYDVPLLKGIVRCKCGCLMAVSRKKLKSRILSHYHCRKRNQQGIEACDMSYIKCDILDNKALDIFKKIEADPEAIMKYTMTEKPKDNTKILHNLETQAMHIQTKIEHLTEILSDAEGSSAARYIITQIEKEDLNLSAARREIEITKAALRHEKILSGMQKNVLDKSPALYVGLMGFLLRRKMLLYMK